MVLRRRRRSHRNAAPTPDQLLNELVEEALEAGVLIRGDLGSGKTTLAVAIARTASQAGALVHFIGRAGHAPLFDRWPAISTRACVDHEEREDSYLALVESLGADDVVVADDDGSLLPSILGTHLRLVVTTSRSDAPGWFDLGTEHRSVIELRTDSSKRWTVECPVAWPRVPNEGR